MQTRMVFLCVVAVLTAGWSLQAEAQKKLPADTAAVVNGKKIPMALYDKEIEKLKKRFAMFGGNIPEAQLAKFKVRILERLVEDELIRQAVSKNRIKVDQALVDAELDEYKKNIPGGEAKFNDFIKRSGQSVDDIKSDIGKRLALKALLAKTQKLSPTDAEIKAYYDENAKRFETKERVKAAHILVKLSDGAPEEEVREARKKINRIYQLAKKPGADFSALAKEKSEGPSAPRGGDLGYFTKGRMVKEFEDAAFSMQPGEVSEPVQTKFGWHVLKVFERDPGGKKSFIEVKADITKRLEASMFREAREKFIKEVNSKARIKKMDIPIPAPANQPSSQPQSP